MPNFMEYLATALFAIAIVHTFSVPVFARLANRGGAHAGLWHLLSEVEAVFGVWACVLLAVMALLSGVGHVPHREQPEQVLERIERFLQRIG